jgi:NADH-quinone oxidoreductase subunit M
MLLTLLFTPLLAALLVPLMPKHAVRQVALVGTLVPLALVIFWLCTHNWFVGPPQGVGVDAAWVEQLGIRFTLGIDGLSMALVTLTAFLGPICVLASYSAITTRIRTYYGWLLVLQAVMTGVFLARDAILFYVMFEFTLVPMFVLISLFGSTNRKAAAIKFFLYTFTGSVLALAGIVYLAWFNTQLPGKLFDGSGSWTFNVAALVNAGQKMSAVQQTWVFFALMAGFAVKVPLFPLHTWLPLAHTEAPTAGSVVLAGVLLKLGTFAMLTLAIPMAPIAAITYAPAIAVLAIIGCIYGGLICWVQTDVKKLVAYSSVAHLGFCVLGMFSFNAAGLQGSVLYMINHGLSTGALFLCIGMMYERYHTRNMAELGGLAIKMPIWASFFVLFTMASVGLPGTNGFVSEFLCVLGAFQAGGNLGAFAGSTGGNLGPFFAFAAGTGMIIGAIYLLYMLGRVCFGPLKEPLGHADHGHGHGSGHGSSHGSGHAAAHGSDDDHAQHLPADLTGREIGILVPIAVACIFFGVYPKPLMQLIDKPVMNTVQLVESTRKEMPAPKAAPSAPSTPATPAKTSTPAHTDPAKHAEVPSAPAAAAAAVQESHS